MASSGPSGRKRKLLSRNVTDSERAQVRREIRDLRRQAYSDRAELMDLKSGRMRQCLDQTNRLERERVTHTTEAVAELENVHQLANINSDALRKSSQQISITINEFIQQLNRHYGPESDDDPFDWRSVGQIAAKYIAAVPPTTFLAGSIMREHKARQAKTRRKIDTNLGPPVDGGKEVQDTSKENKSHNDLRVKKLKNSIRRKAKHNFMPYWKVVINPNSFTQSFENIFDFSFLIKEKLVEMRDNNGVLEIRYRNFNKEESSDAKQPQGSPRRNAQAIIEFDYGIWRQAIQDYDIQSSFIEDRTSTGSGATSGGATSSRGGQ